jgi:hypothetical protein
VKEIGLRGGGVALVDDEDFDLLSQWQWSTRADAPYPYRMVGYRAARRAVFMHRAILPPPDGMEVDHVNGDIFDNRRANLRLATRSQQNQNQRPKSKHGYKGVLFHSKCTGHPWQARITVDGRNLSLGYYVSIELAARAYDAAARKHWGEFARLNFPIQENLATD